MSISVLFIEHSTHTRTMTSKKHPSRSRTVSRKQQHIELTVRKDVHFRNITTGLERWNFLHNALPEMCLEDVDTSTRFLGHTLSVPLMISCMTGGYPGAEKINRELAEVCQETGIALGVGSQRQALEASVYHRTYSVVRETAPTIPIIGNIGAVEAATWSSVDQARKLVDLIHADALAVHLNPLQELLQPEGSPDFRGVLKAISLLVRELPVPVIVKEIGAGISPLVARRLLDVGVRYIDVAGAGGTSWAGVEALRSKDKEFAERFWDWGIPTADAIHAVAALKAEGPSFTLVGSGGISSGSDMAKCVALGADMTASARPLLVALVKNGKSGLKRLLDDWGREYRAIMFLTGSKTIRNLQEAPMLRGLS
jgi:isopentenyl-diphosphate delta-isomerase